MHVPSIRGKIDERRAAEEEVRFVVEVFLSGSVVDGFRKRREIREPERKFPAAEIELAGERPADKPARGNRARFDGVRLAREPDSEIKVEVRERVAG